MKNRTLKTFIWEICLTTFVGLPVLLWLCQFLEVKNKPLIGCLVFYLYFFKLFFTMVTTAIVPTNEKEIKNIRMFMPEKYRIRDIGKYIIKDILFEFLIFPIVFTGVACLSAKHLIFDSRHTK